MKIRFVNWHPIGWRNMPKQFIPRLECVWFKNGWYAVHWLGFAIYYHWTPEAWLLMEAQRLSKELKGIGLTEAEMKRIVLGGRRGNP